LRHPHIAIVTEGAVQKKEEVKGVLSACTLPLFRERGGHPHYLSNDLKNKNDMFSPDRFFLKK
jgi:hypothetical protein